ncbi:MAG: NAD-dependent epimerase/dehydratase family protein [Pseudomonadota bacterium]
MRLIVTGGAGFVGSTLVRQAVMAGHDVINFDALTASASLADIWDLEDAPNYALIPGDVTDRAAFSDLLDRSKPDAVVHLAQEGPHSLADNPTSLVLRTNVLGTEAVLQACKAQNVPRVILAHAMPASTDSPTSPFKASRDSARLVAKAFCDRHDLPVVHSYAPAVFGPRQSPADPIAVTMRRLVQGRTVTIPDGPRTAIDLIYVDDYAAALLWAASDAPVGSSYTFTGPRRIRPLGVARQISNALQSKLPCGDGQYRDHIDVLRVAQGASQPIAEMEDLETILGQTPFPPAFAKTVDWMVDAGLLKPRLAKTAPDLHTVKGVAA